MKNLWFSFIIIRSPAENLYQVLFHPAKPTETVDHDLEETAESDDKPNPNPQHIIIHIHENNRPPTDKPLFYPRPQGWQYGQSSHGQLSIYGEEYPYQPVKGGEKQSRSQDSMLILDLKSLILFLNFFQLKFQLSQKLHQFQK